MPSLNPQIKTILLFALLAALTGFLLLVVFFAFDGYLVVQVLLAAFLLLLWPLGFWLRHRRQQKQAAAAANTDSAVEAISSSSEKPARSYDELLLNAQETVAFLRQNKPSGAQGDALYSFPWFVIAGPEGSGKSALLLSSGQSFNALESQRRAEMNVLRPTAGCDWRVSDDAVWIDTAGRYQSDRADGPDHDEWLGLLDALKRHRKQRPLDGFVLAVSLARLVVTQPDEIERQAQLLRARLNDAMKSCGYRFPVYLVFTHADGVPGFNEYFANLREQERGQVWGVTFALDQADKSHALFDTEFDYLLHALHGRRLLRLSTSREARERLGVFDFPLHLYQLRRPLGAFAQALFRPSNFSDQPLLRGIYFTCCLPPAPAGPDEQPIRETRITQRGLFTADLFSQVFLRDKDVAASFISTQAQPNRVRKYAAATLAAAALCGLWTLGMLVSFFSNNGLINEAQQAAQAVAGHYRKVTSAGPVQGATQTEWSDLNLLQDVLVKMDKYEASWLGSLAYRFGLYTGPQIKPRLREVYFDFVSQRFLNPALKGLAEKLESETPAPAQNAAADNKMLSEDALEQYYYKLKAYLMVETQERIENAFLQNQLAPHWKEYEGANEQRHLSYYTDQASMSDPQDGSVPRLKANASVVANARKKLDSFDPKQQVYNEVIREIEAKGAASGGAFKTREMLSGQIGAEYFDNASSLKVPYAFTKEAYYNYVKGNAWVEVVNKVREGKNRIYVLPDRASEYDRVQPSEILDRYQRSYRTAWIAFLESVRLRKFDDKQQAINALDALSEGDSALAGIFESVKTQTKLSEPPDISLFGKLKAWFDKKSNAQKTDVEKAFAGLDSFNLKEYQSRLEKLSEALRTTGNGDRWSQIVAELEQPNGKYKTEATLARSLLKPLDNGSTPGSKAVGKVLGLPLDNIAEAAGVGGKEDLVRAWAVVVGKARALENRYPFSANSSEVLPDELLKYLTGDLTSFFDQNLKGKKFDATYQPLTPGEFHTDFVSYLNQAFKVRDTLFSAGGKFSYSVTLFKPPSGQAAQLMIDGTTINAESASSGASLSWPPSGGNVGITLSLRALSSPAPVGNTPVLPPEVRPVLNVNGPWAIFRMMDGQSSRMIAVQPPQPNPFALNFRTLRAPNQILTQ